MDLGFTKDQELIRKSAREFFEKQCPKDKVRELKEDEKGYDPKMWDMMVELGYTGLIIPDEYDGRPIKKMGLATNLINAVPSDIDLALDLAAILKLPLTCFHIDYNHSPKLIGKIDNMKEQYSSQVTFDVLKHYYIMDG